MQHNIVRKHRRTVSSIIVGQNQNMEHKATMSTFQDNEDPMHTEIPKPDFIPDKTKHRLRHRAISDLIQACNKVDISKSVMVQELNVSINYKHPVFEFGKDKKFQQLQLKGNLFKKSNTKQLDSIVEKSTQPKSSRLFLRKKVTGVQTQKNSLATKKPSINSVVNSLTKPPQSSHFHPGLVKPKLSEKLEKKEPLSITKQAKKTEIKKNFKF